MASFTVKAGVLVNYVSKKCCKKDGKEVNSVTGWVEAVESSITSASSLAGAYQLILGTIINCCALGFFSANKVEDCC